MKFDALPRGFGWIHMGFSMEDQYSLCLSSGLMKPSQQIKNRGLPSLPSLLTSKRTSGSIIAKCQPLLSRHNFLIAAIPSTENVLACPSQCKKWVKRYAQAKSPVHDKRGQYCESDIGNGGYINFIEIVWQLHTSDLLSMYEMSCAMRD